MEQEYNIYYIVVIEVILMKLKLMVLIELIFLKAIIWYQKIILLK